MLREKLKAELINKKSFEVAKDLGMKPQRFSAIVNGLGISQKVMEEIAEYFGKDPAKLFKGEYRGDE